MIRKFTAKNFVCFRRVEVELRPLTVAIGKNNTGKSTFLRAIRAAQAGPVRTTGTGFRGSGGTSTVDLEPAAKRVMFHYHLPSNGPKMTSKGVEDGKGTPLPESNGDGVPALVDWLLRRDRDRFFGFVDAVRVLVPGVSDVQVATPDAGSRRLDLVSEGWTAPADQSSAGVRLLLFFLALAWHPQPPDVVLIEEPENGVHPERLREVMGLLRGLIEGRHAPKQVQVVLTTHSPYLLSCVEVPKDQVLVFERLDDGSCTAAPLALDRVEPFLRDFGLGEIWTNEGEAGLVARRTA